MSIDLAYRVAISRYGYSTINPPAKSIFEKCKSKILPEYTWLLWQNLPDRYRLYCDLENMAPDTFYRRYGANKEKTAAYFKEHILDHPKRYAALKRYEAKAIQKKEYRKKTKGKKKG